MNLLITICARGGSKGVKDKNIRELGGKPLIAHTIEQALRWGRGSEVVVSTDSERIADVARRSGALVPFRRPEELARDDSPKVGVIQHALVACEKHFSKKYDIVVDLDVTSPIRRAKDLENCHRTFLEKKPWVLFSVVPSHRNPYFNMVEIDSKGFAHLSKPVSTPVGRRQEAPKVYDMNASIYFYSREYLLGPSPQSAFFEKSIVYEMDEISSYDVDREIDFKYLEFLLREGSLSL